MILDNNQISELKDLINNCLDHLYKYDQFIINNSTNERAVVFRFGIYLQDFLYKSNFSDLDLDSEYNRRHSEVKRTQSFPKGIIPDLLIHKRDSQEQNILVMEFKGYWNKDARDNDFLKLGEFTAQELNKSYHYGYGLGASIYITSNRNDIEVIYFTNGEQE